MHDPEIPRENTIPYRDKTKKLKVNFRSCVGVVCTNCVYFNRG